MAQPQADDCSAGLGASNDTVVSAKCSKFFCDCGDGSLNGEELATAPCATVRPSPPMVCVMPNGAQADDIGMDVEMTDGLAESGVCGDMVDVVSKGRSADMLWEKCDVGGLMAPTLRVVQDMASESDSGAACVGKAVLSGSGADVGQPSEDRLGGGAADDWRMSRQSLQIRWLMMVFLLQQGRLPMEEAVSGGDDSNSGTGAAGVSRADVGRSCYEQMWAVILWGALRVGRSGKGYMQAAEVNSRDVVPGLGAAPRAPGSESQADVAWEDELADDSRIEGSMGDRRRRSEATQGGSSEGTDGLVGCSMWPELQAGFRADVGRPAVAAQHLCGPSPLAKVP